MAARLKTARSVAATLAEKSNELNETLVKAQEAITALRLGVSGSVLMYVDEEDGTETYLSYERYDGKWCLTIMSGRPELENWTTTDLLKTTRRTRIAAARRLPELVDDLMKKTETEVGQVDESIATIRSFIKELKEAQS